ncbi:MAG TPA: hypothetical protein VFS66_08365 [Acidimicrobiia bacterium]|nr:hypothetical protein [Acidimicrobiia bacterium]
MSGEASPEPTPRQVLYALVAGGFVVVVVILIIGAAAAGLVPTWWSAALAFLVAIGGTWMALNWRRTGEVLSISIGIFFVWLVGTLILAS